MAQGFGIPNTGVSVSGVYTPLAFFSLTFNTGSLTNNSTAIGTITLAKSFSIEKITISHGCRVRLYSTAANRSSDASRAIGTLPTSSVILDFKKDSGISQELSPIAFGSNHDTVRTNIIYWSITNLSGNTADITITLEYKER